MGSVWSSVQQLTCIHDFYYYVLNEMQCDCDSGCCTCTCKTNRVEPQSDSDVEMSVCDGCCEYTSTSSGQLEKDECQR